MLFRNDIFEFDGVKMRLLSADAQANQAWCIEVDNRLAWPLCLPYREIEDLSILVQEAVQHRRNSHACLSHAEKAWHRLKPLLDKHGQELFDPSSRNRCVLEYARAYKCSPVTLRKEL